MRKTENGIPEIERIDIEGRVETIGIDVKNPTFHYVLSGDGRAEEVRALVQDENQMFWDSGWMPIPAEPYIVYGGYPLRPRSQYRFTLYIRNKSGEERKCDTALCFETGLMEEGFTAEWIEPVQEPAIEEEEIAPFQVFKPSPTHYGGAVRCRPAQNLRRLIEVTKKVRSARIYVTAHGIYELYLNGEKVGKRWFAPEVSAYQKCLYYQVYEAEHLLKEGINVLAVVLADGWWIGRIGLIGSSCQYGNRLGLLLQMEIEYEDGNREVICGDPHFTSHESEIRYADLYIGEMCDRMREIADWKTSERELEGWTSCSLVNYPKNHVTAQPTDGVEVCERLNVQKWIRTPAGELVADFGKVTAGVVELTAQTEEGQKITLEYCETLDKDGNYIRNIMGRNKDQTDVIVGRKEITTWAPHFTYHGFRYVKVSGIERNSIINLQALALMSRMRKSGDFCCSSNSLNQLRENIDTSQRTNMISIPTDCPQREKMGWTGDIQIYAKTAAFHYDVRSFLKAWLTNLRLEQKEDGAVPVIAPNFPKQEKMQRQIGAGCITSSGWSDACVLLPWYLYEAYGEIGVLCENFNCMKRYLEYVKRESAKPPRNPCEMTAEQRERNPYLWNTGYHYGDWLIPSLHRLPDGVAKGRAATREIVGSCWYAITVEIYLHICCALAKNEAVPEEMQKAAEAETKEKESLLMKIRAAVAAEYVSADGRVGNGELQGLYVMVLRAGAVQGRQKELVAQRLVELIRENEDRLDTGFSSIGFLLDVLCENGYRDLAYKILFQKKSPSWLYMTEHGATSIWESWEAVREDGSVTNVSYNHYAFGCVGDWIYRNIGGIAPVFPGYRKIWLAPDVDCGLTWAKCSRITPFGLCACEWERKENRVSVKVTIPVGAVGELHIGKLRKTLSQGTYRFECEM